MAIKIKLISNLCTYLFLLNINLCFAKICDKLNPVNVDLQCFVNGKNITCDEYSELQSGTIVRPTCKPKYKYYDSTQNYKEIKCNHDGKWDNLLSPCIPECGKPYAKPELLISGGVVQNIGSHPWHVAIYNSNELLICGGTIITPQLVLSAAHCFRNDTSIRTLPRMDDYFVVVSKFTRNYRVKDNDYQKTFKIADIRFPDRGFFGLINNFGSDIVILILNDTITLGPTTLPACIDWSGVKGREYLKENMPGRVAGWGLNERNRYGENLTTVDLPFISHKRCLDFVPDDFKSFITFDKFCAGAEGGPSVQQGDSGGGLLFKKDDIYFLRGIVSLRQPSLSYVVAFTDITDHLDWITSVRNEVEIQPLKKAYQHYETLFNQIKNTTQEDDDIMKLYDISKGLQDEVIDQKNITEKLNSQARSLFETVRTKMQALAAQKISDAFLNDHLATVNRLGSRLVNTCYQCFNQIIEKVIDNVLGKLGIKGLLELVRKPNGFCCIPELISIYTAVFHKLQQNGELNNDSIIQLAYRVKELMEWGNYGSVESTIRAQMSSVKNNLPKSVKNIVFSTKLCLRNVRFHEYLFSPSQSNYLHDQDRRFVFTWKGGDRYDAQEPGIFFWKLERNDDRYEIVNSQFNEHLYADIDGSLKVEGHRRPVLTWKKGGSRSGSSWKLEPDGDYVYIKNVENNEFLFADFDNKKDEERRFVYSFVRGGKTYDSKWEMVDCSDFESKVRAQIKDPTKKLPNSLKNMAFSTKICIRNVRYNEFLYAVGPSEFWYDNDRRNVFTWKGGNGYGPGESGKFAWILQRNDNDEEEYQIVNSQFNEHLYAEIDGSLLDGHRRYVMTWRKGGSRDGSSWKFEHDGDNVYIKNAHNGEYLFADILKKRDDDRRFVYTFILGSRTNDSQWEMVDCDNTVSDTGYLTEDTKAKPSNQLFLPKDSSSAKVCIRNVRYNEYLYAPGPSTYWHDQDRRYIFTKKDGERYDPNEPGKFIWILNRTNDQYQIINSQFNELLYADVTGSLPIEGHRRYILSWRKGGQRTGSNWKLEPEGDYVYIKNVHNNEYLFADFDKKRDEDNRFVFSFIYGSKTIDSKWEIIDCTNFESSVQSQIKDITKKVPNSLKNIVFAAHVCIKNTYYNEYLYAAGSPTHWYDQDRRNVFTWKGRNRYGPDERRKFAWKLERNSNNDEFQIINYQFKEHLYVEMNGTKAECNHCRNVFTWRKNGARLGTWWKFEHDGDHVYIKNAQNNEYLFADCCNNVRDEERRFVFSYIPGGKTIDSKWEIIDCSSP